MKTKLRKSKKKVHIPKRLLILTLAVLLIAGLLAYRYNRRGAPVEQVTTTDTEKIDLSPPTDTEITETEQHKANLTNQTSPESVVAGKYKVTPVITVASQEELRSFVSGIVEDGGICTATFTSGNFSFTRTSKGTGDASNSTCQVITLRRGDFATSGTWTVTLSYSSDKAYGISQPSKFEVK